MPDVLPYEAPYPNAIVGWTGTVWHCLHVDAAGNLQVDVLGNANLDNALQSVNTDALQVRGEDQLHSYHDPLLSPRNFAVVGANGYADSDVCPANEVWIITSVAAMNVTRPITGIDMYIRRGFNNYSFHREDRAIAQSTFYTVQVEKWIEENDFIRVLMPGAAAADDAWIVLTGHIMMKE